MIRLAIVDDEPPARAKLRGLLAREDDVELVDEAGDGVAAVELIVREGPELVLLDVQMPRLDGFGVIEEIGVEAMPAVIFVTAFDEHALRAFEVHAFDYLLKPFSAQRLASALARFRTRRGPQPALERVLEDRPQPLHPLRRLLVESGANRHQLLNLLEVDLIRSRGNDVELVAGGHSHRRRATLARLEKRLDPEQFLRINRSEIVRLDAIAEVQSWFHGDAKVLMKNGEVLSWSRRYRAKDRGRFDLE